MLLLLLHSSSGVSFIQNRVNEKLLKRENYFSRVFTLKLHSAIIETSGSCYVADPANRIQRHFCNLFFIL